MREFIVVAMLTLLASATLAATISGQIYDSYLSPGKNAIVKINTIPEQTYVAKQGTYSLTVPKGKYTLTVTLEEDFASYRAQQNVTVVDDGKYVADIILEPDLSEEESLLDENLEPPESLPEQPMAYWFAFSAVMATIGMVLLLRARKKTFAANQDLAEKVMGFVKSSGGRTTQKEIRKNFSVSEATISLVLRELVAKKKIEKIKQGKGNIIKILG